MVLLSLLILVTLSSEIPESGIFLIGKLVRLSDETISPQTLFEMFSCYEVFDLPPLRFQSNFLIEYIDWFLSTLYFLKTSPLETRLTKGCYSRWLT